MTIFIRQEMHKRRKVGEGYVRLEEKRMKLEELAVNMEERQRREEREFKMQLFMMLQQG